MQRYGILINEAKKRVTVRIIRFSSYSFTFIYIHLQTFTDGKE